MKSIAILVQTIFLFSYCFSQETLNYKGVSASFPCKYTNKEVKGVNVFYANKDSVSYQVMMIEDSTRTFKNLKALSDYLGGLSKGFIEGAGNDFKSTMSDTSIGGVNGRYLHLYEPTQHHAFREAWAFFTALINHPYSIQVLRYGTIDETSNQRIKDFFSSLKFEGRQFATEESNNQDSYTGRKGNVAFSFPDSYDSSVVNGLKFYRCRKNDLVLSIAVSDKSHFNIHKQSDFAAKLQKVTSGYISSAAKDKFTQETKDTTIGNAKGKLVTLSSASPSNKFQNVISFITIIEDRVYVAVATTSKEIGADDRKIINSFFDTVKFSGNQF